MRIVWKNRPAIFHPQARSAALAAQALFSLKGHDAFWSFFAKALRNQGELGLEAYERWAVEEGVDLAKFREESTAARSLTKLDEDHTLAIKLMTPENPTALYVNGLLAEYLEVRR